MNINALANAKIGKTAFFGTHLLHKVILKTRTMLIDVRRIIRSNLFYFCPSDWDRS